MANVIAQKDDTIGNLEQTVEIMSERLKRMEMLLEVKDQKIAHIQ